jgi:hypothetical protein
MLVLVHSNRSLPKTWTTGGWRGGALKNPHDLVVVPALPLARPVGQVPPVTSQPAQLGLDLLLPSPTRRLDPPTCRVVPGVKTARAPPGH